MGRMEAESFPAAIIASWLIVAAIGIGTKLARQENKIGIEPKWATPFVFGCIFLVCALWYFEDVSPVIYHIASDLIGALIGLGSAYFGLRFVDSLRRGPSQRQEPPR